MSATVAAASATSSPRTAKAYQTILCAGLIAGTLDITAACVRAWLRTHETANPVTPLRVGRYIASAAIGTSALTGGRMMALLGFAFHYLIATTAAAVFYLASRKLRFLVEWPVSMGLLYGVLVYLFMNFVVVPLSKLGFRASPLSNRLVEMLIIMLCVGLPIALIVRRFSK